MDAKIRKGNRDEKVQNQHDTNTITEIPVKLDVTKCSVDVKRGMAPPKPRSPAICSLPEPSRATGTDACYVLRKSWRAEGVGRNDEHVVWNLV